jgi:hypothetical protein
MTPGWPAPARSAAEVSCPAELRAAADVVHPAWLAGIRRAAGDRGAVRRPQTPLLASRRPTEMRAQPARRRIGSRRLRRTALALTAAAEATRISAVRWAAACSSSERFIVRSFLVPARWRVSVGRCPPDGGSRWLQSRRADQPDAARTTRTSPLTLRQCRLRTASLLSPAGSRSLLTSPAIADRSR